MDIIQDVLIYQTQMMRNSSLGPYVPADFSPPDHIVVVNALFYASLGIMILAAFIAMLIKSWVHEFDRGLRAMSLPERRAKTHEFRYLGMEHWRLPEMVAILPSLIQVSLLLFAIGLVLFLFYISIPSFGVTTAIFGIGVLYYAITTSVSVFVASSPFHSPVSRALGKVYRYVHAYFCPSIDDFLSHVMDMTPSTTLGRARRGIHVILLKSRPYLEEDFVKPITAITVDEVQLSTAALALKRIHDSAPNSQHSEALQSSVWQVAGGTAQPFRPLFSLPPWILDIENSVEHLSHLSPAILVAMVTISLRARHIWDLRDITSGAVRRGITDSEDPWTHVIVKVSDPIFDPKKAWWRRDEERRHTQALSNDLTNMIRRKELHKEECLLLLRTLSELRSEGSLSQNKPQSKPFFIEICLPILMSHATKWDDRSPPDIVLLEAVVTLAAISCTSDNANQLSILSSSRDHPWLLLNIRNTNLISSLYESTHRNDHKRLTSLLFLIVYALMHRESYALAAQYFTTITARGDLPLYASALTAIAPSMTERGLYAIGRAIIALRTEDIASIYASSRFYVDSLLLENMFYHYDEQLGASKNPDPSIIAILLILSKHRPLALATELPYGEKVLKNPSLNLVARVAARLDIPDGFVLPMRSFYDRRLHNMIAALSLLGYTQGTVAQSRESLLLASLLQSRELAISSVALEYYMKTTISYSDPPAPSSFLAAAVSSAFNVMLPEGQLGRRWELLDIFVDGFETLSVEWRRSFAEGFFTVSSRPLPKLQEDMESSTPESELRAILTWEYFHAEEQEPELTDSQFSGLDWMAMAWSLRLSQRSRRNTAGSRQGKAQLQHLIGLEVNEEFVFRALCKLLDAAPYYRIIPIIPRLLEFIQWFDGKEPPEYRSMISRWVNDTVRRNGEFQILYRFRKFHCTWDI